MGGGRDKEDLDLGCFMGCLLQVAEGKEDAEKQFQEAVSGGTEDGEQMCTDMISLACR